MRVEDWEGGGIIFKKETSLNDEIQGFRDKFWTKSELIRWNLLIV